MGYTTVPSTGEPSIVPSLSGVIGGGSPEEIQPRIWRGSPCQKSILQKNVRIPWLHSGKTNIAMENGPFEDVFPIEIGDIPLPC